MAEAVAERAVEAPVQAVAAVEEPVADAVPEGAQKVVAVAEAVAAAALAEAVAAMEEPVADTAPEVAEHVAAEEPAVEEMLFEAVAERAVEVPVQAIAAVEESVADAAPEVAEQVVASPNPPLRRPWSKPSRSGRVADARS